MFGNTESGLMTDDGFRAEDFNEVYEASPVKQDEPSGKPGKWALRDRLKSKVLWAAIVGCIITVFSAFDIWSKIGITAEGFREIAASAGAVLAAFGVLNDPTNREGF
jgi:uncharacterized membrane protein